MTTQVDDGRCGRDRPQRPLRKTSCGGAAVEPTAGSPWPTRPRAAPEAQAASAPADGVTLTSGQIVNLREGPGTNYLVVGQLAPGQRYNITGKNEDGRGGRLTTAAATRG